MSYVVLSPIIQTVAQTTVILYDTDIARSLNCIIGHLSCFHVFPVINTTVTNCVHKQAQTLKMLRILTFMKHTPEIGLGEARCDESPVEWKRFHILTGRGRGALDTGIGASACCSSHLCACAHLLRVPSAFGNRGEQRRKPRSHPLEAQRLGAQSGKEPENSYQCTSLTVGTS